MSENSVGIIKKANRYLVFDALLKNESLTIEDILNKTKLSRPTVLNILAKMMQENIVIKEGIRDTEEGRKPILYSINKNAFYAVGIDVEIPFIRLVIVDIKGNVLYSDKWAHPFDDSIDNISDELIQRISQAITNSNINAKDITGIGIGMPGTFSASNHKPVFMTRVKDSISIPMDLKIQEYFNIPVTVMKDADCGARVEKENLNSDSSNNFIYISCRSGIGMAVCVGGQLYRGLGAPSYIGHISYISNGLPCECGNRGCLELYCSKMAIVKNYCKLKDLDISSISYNEILNLEVQGDEDAINILREAGECLGIGISDMIKVFDLHTVVIGCSECNENSVFFRTTVDATLAHVFGYLRDDLEIIFGSQDEFCPAKGASLFVFDNYFDMPHLQLNI